MSEGFVYTGRELEAMTEAANYHRWILDIFKPYLGKHLVEVGAGLGSFSELILKNHDCETLSLVEPSEQMCERLVVLRNDLNTATRVEAYHSTFLEAAPLIAQRQMPDSIIYVNVLEHIADDEGELKAICRSLSDGGHALIFVPALPWLHGSLDDRVGHFRRYTKSEVEGKLRRAGFKVLRSAYFDLPGIVPWWVMSRLLRSDTVGGGAISLYDRLVVPTLRRIETLVPPPIGKNIIAVARKG
jgi:SAM-dependent methyltransferase